MVIKNKTRFRGVSMTVKAVNVSAKENLVVDKNLLEEAGLTGRLRLIIQKGEIRILSESDQDAETMLEELAGCLGYEPATEYDFHLKIGGLYEAR
jgi:hypothetical protein